MNLRPTEIQSDLSIEGAAVHADEYHRHILFALFTAYTQYPNHFFINQYNLTHPRAVM